MRTNLLWRVVLIVAVTVIFAISLIPTTKDPEPIRRGLDLKGGTQLVMRVNVGDALRLELDQAGENLKAQARKNSLPVPTTRRVNDTTLQVVPPSGVNAAVYQRLTADYQGQYDVSTNAEGSIELRMKPTAVTTIERDTVAHAVETIDNRVNAMGVSETYIAPSTGNRIIIQLPGVDDPARVKDIIKTTAQLQFRIVEGRQASTTEAALATVPDNMKTEVDVLPITRENELGQAVGTDYVAVRKVVPVTGRDLKNARPTQGELGRPVIGFSMTPEGGRKFGELTGANVGRQLAIVLDNKVMSAPTIEERIEDQGIIRGSFTPQQVSDLSLVLRSGSLPASLTTLEERTVGPSLGRDSIIKGVTASLIGFALIVLSVVIYYKGAGVNAVLALLLNLLIILGCMAYFDAALTLPGIAGLILTLAMAIDSNVLVFERIREELRGGRPVKAAISKGFELAFGTIIDTHMTTIIAALFLLQFGTSAVKGFAVTLLIGLAASVFTAFFVSRVIFEIVYNRSDRPATSISI